MKKLGKRGIVILVLAAVLLVSGGMVVRRLVEYRLGDQEYEEAQELVQLPDLDALPQPDESQEPQEEQPVYVDPYADALAAMDFSALREVNSDVLGWILIPGTNLSYPLLQGDDNQYYLNHTWRKSYNSVGAIFMECRNSADLSDFNTIIYGHRMNNRSMFGILHQYTSQNYWKSHPYIYITDDNGSHRYQVFAAYEVSTSGAAYQIGFSGDTSKQAFLDACLAQSVIDTGVTPHVYDKILTLSTCTGDGHATRWVVQAVLPGTPPAQTEEPQEEPVQQPEEQPQEQPDTSTETPDSSQTQQPPVEEDPPSQDIHEEDLPQEDPPSQDIHEEDLPQEDAPSQDIGARDPE